MAKNKEFGVWGIDIGQCALKALRCVKRDGQIVADAYEYIEYPKMLSQPDADAQTLVRDALEQFAEQNDLQGDQIAVAVPGQNGLAKFFKPPPIESKKIPDLVEFEAKQQIPFDLEDVIWDYQQFGGVESEGFVVDTEIGLFAMKREQVERAVRPYEDLGLELDIVQLAPLAIYNFVTYDMLPQLDDVEFDPDNPPPSWVVLSVGTDTTDLVITNGFRMWQRSIPLGGNHFTKQLTKSLKLTFAKAEHLKRNIHQAEDRKSVFTAMRPVFNDLLNEIQRSIGYFQSLDRKAQIEGVVMLGNTVRLPQLKQFLAKNLGYKVVDYDGFKRLVGDEILSSPAFKNNILSYGVAYGLCLQGLGFGQLHTNLLPPEIITERMIRAKKPWAIASAAAVMIACAFMVIFEFKDWRLVRADREVNRVKWSDASQRVQSVQSESTSLQSKDSELKTKLAQIAAIGEELVGNAERRLTWLELLKGLNAALPRTPGIKPGEIPDVEKLPLSKRHELYIEYVDSTFMADVSKWFTPDTKARYIDSRYVPPGESGGKTAAAPGGPAATVPAGNSPAAGGAMAPATGAAPNAAGAGGAAELAPPQGEGWIIELKLTHYFNEELDKQGATHVTNTLIKNLEYGQVALPAPARKLLPGVQIVVGGKQLRVEQVAVQRTPAADGKPGVAQVTLTVREKDAEQPQQLTYPAEQPVDVVFTYKELGISYPVIMKDSPVAVRNVPNPNYAGEGNDSGGSAAGGKGGMMGGMGIGGPGGVSGGGPPASGGMPGGGMPGGAAGPGGPGMPGQPGGGMPGQPGPGMPGGNPTPGKDAGNADHEVPATIRVKAYDCVVQFVWQEKLLTDRLEAKHEAWKAARQVAPQNGTGGPDSVAQR